MSVTDFLAHVEEQLKAGTLDVTTPGPNGYVPLFCAAIRGRVMLMEQLIAAGADPHVTADDGSTILHYLSSTKSGYHVGRLANKYGLDINAVDDLGLTPLHTAIHYEQLGAVKSIVRNGASNLHAKVRGATPFYYAVFMRKPKIATYLSTFVRVSPLSDITMAAITIDIDTLIELYIRDTTNVYDGELPNPFTVFRYWLNDIPLEWTLAEMLYMIDDVDKRWWFALTCTAFALFDGITSQFRIPAFALNFMYYIQTIVLTATVALETTGRKATVWYFTSTWKNCLAVLHDKDWLWRELGRTTAVLCTSQYGKAPHWESKFAKEILVLNDRLSDDTDLLVAPSFWSTMLGVMVRGATSPFGPRVQRAWDVLMPAMPSRTYAVVDWVVIKTGLDQIWVRTSVITPAEKHGFDAFTNEVFVEYDEFLSRRLAVVDAHQKGKSFNMCAMSFMACIGYKSILQRLCEMEVTHVVLCPDRLLSDVPIANVGLGELPCLLDFATAIVTCPSLYNASTRMDLDKQESLLFPVVALTQPIIMGDRCFGESADTSTFLHELAATHGRENEVHVKTGTKVHCDSVANAPFDAIQTLHAAFGPSRKNHSEDRIMTFSTAKSTGMSHTQMRSAPFGKNVHNLVLPYVASSVVPCGKSAVGMDSIAAILTNLSGSLIAPLLLHTSKVDIWDSFYGNVAALETQGRTDHWVFAEALVSTLRESLLSKNDDLRSMTCWW